ncbi:octanoyltransferase LipM [Virgibacillus pantothenticus]|uniref:Octanoyltransferase n=1 Tax=Virgibacillus pantothenticus TaxID=1473 RepID=A0A0L0QTQ8_VIRPA|nr:MULTISPECIES: lipoate--protein ligase family protein [Virgibacillus]API91782.1 octanoyltransferase [Virgibacillus sp. 6R]KNE21578.1 octanoyltransferase [Virgibacillus pantothenticus]MBS7427906.1 lipoate--protein ligase family protein [Virgibacillus sp. 19R1-5]MED3736207.1 lipoate--protein ligase family protein [Virgibacillus pantothenticus]QTY15996.1 lipoate--protein ligase family protein [Virgibacillus pantothenticus]
MKEQWGFLENVPHDAAINMALDEALLQWHYEEKIPPTLRFYQWRKPTLSIGHFQKLEGRIDLEGVQKHQCQLVRRMTGGSAVLHDDELTYSIVISESHPSVASSIRQAYYDLSKGILEGYNHLGIKASYAESVSKERSNICFERPAFYEMVVDGKKLSGNAQTRKKGVLLQHGSIPISMNVDMLFDMFIFPNEKIKMRKKQAFWNKATTINRILQKNISYDTVKAAFKKGFSEGLEIELKEFSLTKSQWNEVYRLAEKKYANLPLEGAVSHV